MILWHGQKDLVPLSLVIGNIKVATKIWAGPIAIEGLDAIIETGCRHYCTLGPVRYLADYIVANISKLKDILNV